MMEELLAEGIELGGRVLLAAILGVVVAYRRQTDPHHQSILQSHAYLAVAGAMFIMIIGDHFTRAIGLIGVATIIRYRYAIRNPKDAGTLIIALGLGMACGTGELVFLAILGAAFMVLIVRLLEALPSILPGKLFESRNETRLRLVTINPEETLANLQTVLDREHIDHTLASLDRKRKADLQIVTSTIEVRLRFSGDLDISRLTADLADEYVQSVTWKQTEPTEIWV
ncbi:MAG: MgtC/SapB family protein [Candidatus Eiseniibacteriota bacterium]|jgi:uncharacterized membrane protein YhiD involved in acid resistance